MALTVSKLRGKDAKALTKTPNMAIHIVSVSFDTVYNTGGEPFNTLYDQPIVAMWHLYGGTYHFQYNIATGKIEAYDGAAATLAEVADMTNLSGQTGVVFAVLVDHNA